MRPAGSLLALMVLLLVNVPLPAQDGAGDTVRVVEKVPSAPIDSTRHRLAGGNHGATNDATTILVRRPAAERLKKFTDDNDFLYDRKPRDPETLGEKILRWLRDNIYGNSVDSAWRRFWTLITSWPSVIIISLGLVFLLLKSGGLRSAFLRKGDAVELGFTEIEENIETMDFDRLIEEAAEARNFRRAVRLHYLKLLKEMGSRQMISLRMEKTNHDYLRELTVPELRDPFARVTLLFEYVWYGDLPVDEATFRGLRESFIGFGARVRGES